MSLKIQLIALALVAALTTAQSEAAKPATRKLAPVIKNQLVAGHDKMKQAGGKVSATLAKVVETLKAGKDCSQEDLLIAIREVQKEGHLLRGARPQPMGPMSRMVPCC